MMDFNQAILLLGLNYNFTWEELKNAYRKLSHEYHPDKYEGTELYEEMQRKQQEINLAKDFLKKHLETNQKAPQFNLKEYIVEKTNELKKIINNTGENIKDDDFNATLHSIKKIIDNFVTSTFIPQLLNKQEVDQYYDESMSKIKKKFDNLKQFFYKRHGIKKEDVKQELNYSCTLKEFYEQLTNIEKNIKIWETENKLSKEMQKYRYFVGYEKLEKMLDVSFQEVLFKIIQNNFQDIQKHIDEMHQQITTIFQRYYIIAQVIKELELTVKETKDKKIQDTYANIKNNFYQIESLEGIQTDIMNLKDLIKRHQQHLNKIDRFKQNEGKINEIYKSLIHRYNKIISNCNIVNEYPAINKLNELLEEVLNLFHKGCNELRSIDYFQLFEQISFLNLDEDTRIIEFLKTNSSQVSIQEQENYIQSNDTHRKTVDKQQHKR